MRYSYDRQGSSNTTLSDRFSGFFEEVATALQAEWPATSHKFRVSEKQRGQEYMVEIITGSEAMYDLKVHFKLDKGSLLFAIEHLDFEASRAPKSEKVGVGTASMNVSPDGLAKIVRGVVHSKSISY